MCAHRVDEGQKPACVEACSKADHKAMLFGDLKDPNSEISLELKKHGGEQIRADLGLNTGVRYQNL
jgi:molybdopterin-containing oxidoreductase family iron-sulfur binding subunit